MKICFVLSESKKSLFFQPNLKSQDEMKMFLKKNIQKGRIAIARNRVVVTLLFRHGRLDWESRHVKTNTDIETWLKVSLEVLRKYWCGENVLTCRESIDVSRKSRHYKNLLRLRLDLDWYLAEINTWLRLILDWNWYLTEINTWLRLILDWGSVLTSWEGLTGFGKNWSGGDLLVSTETLGWKSQHLHQKSEEVNMANIVGKTQC